MSNNSPQRNSVSCVFHCSIFRIGHIDALLPSTQGNMCSVKHIPLTETLWQLKDQPLFFAVVLRDSREAFLPHLCETEWLQYLTHWGDVGTTSNELFHVINIKMLVSDFHVLKSVDWKRYHLNGYSCGKSHPLWKENVLRLAYPNIFLLFRRKKNNNNQALALFFFLYVFDGKPEGTNSPF